ncbi:MAG TPA: arginine repressor [Blastocatellia bacterium]|nr:arginine repressor [Blastocatellia bacterium]
MSARERREKLKQLIASKQMSRQAEIVEELKRLGFSVTQSCVSRDIARLGIVKMNGVYSLPRSLHPLTHGQILALDTAGDNLIVIKTEPGEAAPVALAIDHAQFAEVVGTVAGDDTLFVAVKTAADQQAALRRIKELFNLTEATIPAEGSD